MIRLLLHARERRRQIRALRLAIDRLPDELRDTYQRIAVDGETITSVAQRQGRSIDETEGVLVEALLRLRADLDASLPADSWHRLMRATRDKSDAHRA